MTLAENAQPATPPPPPVSGWTEQILALRHRRATWVLIDQGIVSLGNFLTGIFFIRGVTQQQSGAYQVLFDTMLYLNSLQNALVIYPLLVKGATSTDKSNLGRLASASIVLTCAMLPFLGAATIFAVGVLHSSQVAVAAVAAVFFWQLQETLRRGLTADLRFADAIWGDSVSYLGQAGLIILLSSIGKLDLERTFAVMAGTSAVAVVIQAFQIGLKPIRVWQLRLIARDFWRLGRWMLLTNASGIITMIGYSWTLLFVWKEDANAIFLAIGQAFKLANPIMSSMAGLITPAVARESVTNGMRSATRMALRYVLLGALMLAPYFLLLIIFAEPVLKFLSKGDKPYYEYANLLRLFVANYTVVYLTSVAGAWLAGLGRSRYNFYVQMGSLVATVFAGLPLTVYFGVAGLIWGGLISCVVSLALACYFIYHLAHMPHALGHAVPADAAAPAADHSPGNL